MTTEKQIQANRENAKLGGVKTEEGKEISKYNALKHGLLSDKVLVKGESRAELEELRTRLINDFKPKTEIERLLVDRVASNFWRLRRAMSKDEDILSICETFSIKSETLMRYETMLEKGIYKVLRELRQIQANYKSEE